MEEGDEGAVGGGDGEEVEEGDEGAVGGGDREESEEQPTAYYS